MSVDYAPKSISSNNLDKNTAYAYFGMDGQPVLIKEGYARVIDRYDSHGRKIESRYLGGDGTPITHKDGYARLNLKYDLQGNVIEYAFWGLNGGENTS